MRFTISKSEQKDPFALHYMQVDEYVVDTRRKFEGFEPGDLICYVTMFDIFQLDIAIRRDGSLIFRGWCMADSNNTYLHTSANPEEFTPTQEQLDTVAGLFSGRITFEGLKIAVGASVQKVCPIDIEAEQKRTGKTIYLA